MFHYCSCLISVLVSMQNYTVCCLVVTKNLLSLWNRILWPAFIEVYCHKSLWLSQVLLTFFFGLSKSQKFGIDVFFSAYLICLIKVKLGNMGKTWSSESDIIKSYSITIKKKHKREKNFWNNIFDYTLCQSCYS